LAARGEHVEDRVENLAHIDRTLAAAAPRGGIKDDTRAHCVDEIGGITKATAMKSGRASDELPSPEKSLNSAL
jgi:hypothetical protein